MIKYFLTIKFVFFVAIFSSLILFFSLVYLFYLKGIAGILDEYLYFKIFNLVINIVLICVSYPKVKESAFSKSQYLQLELINTLHELTSIQELETVLIQLFPQIFEKKQIQVKILEYIELEMPAEMLNTFLLKDELNQNFYARLNLDIAHNQASGFYFLKFFDSTILVLCTSKHEEAYFLKIKDMLETVLKNFKPYIRKLFFKEKLRRVNKYLIKHKDFEDKEDKGIHSEFENCFQHFPDIKKYCFFELNTVSNDYTLLCSSHSNFDAYKEELNKILKFYDSEFVKDIFFIEAEETNNFYQRLHVIAREAEALKVLLVPLSHYQKFKGVCILWLDNTLVFKSEIRSMAAYLRRFFIEYTILSKQNDSFLEMQLLNNLEQGILFFNKDRQLFFYNKNVENYLGFDLTKMSKIEDFEDILPGFKPQHMFENKNYIIELNSKILYLEFKLLQDQDSLEKFVMTIEDITGIKEMQKQKESYERLALVASISSKISHEIKNPLVSVKTFTQLLPRRWQDEEYRGMFQQFVIQQVDRMNMMCQTLLKLGRNTPNLKKEHTLAALWANVQLKNQDPKLSYFLLSDINTYKTFLNELDILDALKYMIDNALDSSVEASRVSVFFEVKNDFFEFRIEDDGKGFQKNGLAYACDPFYSTKPGHPGLGLTLSKKIAEDHTGHLAITREDTISRIIFQIPFLTENIVVTEDIASLMAIKKRFQANQ